MMNIPTDESSPSLDDRRALRGQLINASLKPLSMIATDARF